jgi:hypothetical protein
MKWKRQSRSGHPRVGTTGAMVSTTHGNQGNRANFFHPRAGRAVKRGQQPGRAATGPTERLVLSESGHPSRGWRDNSRKSGVSTDAVSRKC